jgi:hypothetical protein
MFCKFCESLSIESLVSLAEVEFSSSCFPIVSNFHHYGSYDELVDSANSGCELCLLIYTQFKEIKMVAYPWEGQTWEEALTELKSRNQAEDTAIRLSINTSHLPSCSGLDEVKNFDRILVQIGPPQDSGEDPDDEAAFWYLETMALTLTVPRGKIRMPTLSRGSLSNN